MNEQTNTHTRTDNSVIAIQPPVVWDCCFYTSVCVCVVVLDPVDGGQGKPNIVQIATVDPHCRILTRHSSS